MDSENGFTLVELLVTLVIAMVIMAGLMATFVQQNSEYKYQNKRIDAVQDLEFGIRFIADDIRSALVDAANPTAPLAITNDVVDGYTSDLSFTVWDELAGDPYTKRATRHYIYDGTNKILKYDRHDPSLTSTGKEILSNVTYFKVFNDSVDSRAGFTGIPTALPPVNLPDPAADNVPGYTILIEIEVDAGYKEGSFIDVRGNNVGISGHKRVWRYVQVHPKTSVQ
ncbi:hypothetical protein D6779_10000 [Candidatus Parcubacteria bacterium]|nr:MAG: hypothetical protein D6779_10000 [Candidatus Parcubacteria bacterium]